MTGMHYEGVSEWCGGVRWRMHSRSSASLRLHAVHQYHPGVLTGAQLLYAQGKTSEALDIMKQVLATTKKIFGPNHPDVKNAEQGVAVLSANL